MLIISFASVVLLTLDTVLKLIVTFWSVYLSICSASAISLSHFKSSDDFDVLLAVLEVLSASECSYR